MSPSAFDSDRINSPKAQSRRSGTTGRLHHHALGSAGHRGWTAAAYMPTALHCLQQNRRERYLINQTSTDILKNIYKWAEST